MLAPVSCSADTVRLCGVGFGFWLMGKLGRARVGACVGAWVYGGAWLGDVLWGVGNAFLHI